MQSQYRGSITLFQYYLLQNVSQRQYLAAAHNTETVAIVCSTIVSVSEQLYHHFLFHIHKLAQEQPKIIIYNSLLQHPFTLLLGYLLFSLVLETVFGQHVLKRFIVHPFECICKCDINVKLSTKEILDALAISN